ncbi:MAG: lysine--tRNA ligase [Armatimonadota bacterium]|nr:lysine--tRNA ligase [Armatimonadota bacterium]
MEDHRQPEQELIQARYDKLQRLRELGKDPYTIERYERWARLLATEGAVNVEPYSEDIKSAFEQVETAVSPGESESSAEHPSLEASIAGRIVSLRIMGKAAFAHIQDRKGKIQVYFKRDDLGTDYELVDLLDLGDIIGVEGFVFRTRTGEITLHARSFQILAKSLRPIPFGKEKGDKHWYGLQDVEQRYRQRHIDLIINEEVRQTFEKRSQIIRAIREFYDARGYLEVETPVLQLVAGGAAARPFITYYNALEHEFKLRISLELYLKRLIIGGLEKVYEIGRVFRNEGLSPKHNPEFTLLESYEAYAQLEDVMDLVEDLFRYICRTLYGGTTFDYQGITIDLAGPWRRLPILEGIRIHTGIEPSTFDSFGSALKAMQDLGLPTEGETMVGGIIEKIHERFVQPHLVQPTFVTDFPIETSPLAKKRLDNPRLVRRFEAYVARQEVANAFSELNDPIDQRERFEQQMKMRAGGDEEAHPMDEDFLRALECGMPPTGGLGIGIDRLVMVFCGESNVRDVILFPQMRPERRL